MVLPGTCSSDENSGRIPSDHESFNLELDRVDLAGKFLVLVRGDAGSDDGPSNTAGTAQCSLGLHEDVWDVLSQDKILDERLLRACRDELTFSSQSRGRWRRISSGSVSAVRMMSSAIPRLRVLVAVGRGRGIREIC